MKAQAVCFTHGGAAPQARQAAQARIDASADMAAAHLIEWMNSAKVPYNIRLQAAKDLLDRANIGTDKTLTLELKPFEVDIESLLLDVEEPEGADLRIVRSTVVSPPDPPALPAAKRGELDGPRRPTAY
jgi:hypothetical protein